MKDPIKLALSDLAVLQFENLELLVHHLWIYGHNEIYIAGSFVSDKEFPRDIDGYFECDMLLYAKGKIIRELVNS